MIIVGYFIWFTLIVKEKGKCQIELRASWFPTVHYCHQTPIWCHNDLPKDDSVQTLFFFQVHILIRLSLHIAQHLK